MQEGAHHEASMWPGDGLHEEEIMQLEAQRMGPPVGSLEVLHRLVELERLAGQQHELRDHAQVKQH